MIRVAAIDAGSNAIRFVVADFDGPLSYTVVHKIREPIRLGHNVFTQGDLAEGAMDQAVAAFRRFRSDMDALGVERFRAVATSATREATNRDLLLDRILAESGIALEPISGREEARLVHLAVGGRVDLSEGRWILGRPRGRQRRGLSRGRDRHPVERVLPGRHGSPSRNPDGRQGLPRLAPRLGSASSSAP